MAHENHANENVKLNSQSNNREPAKRNCTITKDIFNSEAKFRVKDMLDKALQLRQSRLNIEQSENTVDLDDAADFKEAPRFKRSLRLKNKNLPSSSSSVTSVGEVIVIDAENQPHGLVHTYKSSDKLPQSSEDRNGCEDCTQLKNATISSMKEIVDCKLELGLSTDEVKDSCRMCLICGKTFDLLDFKMHSIECLKHNFSKPDKNKALTGSSTEQVKCHICNKNITYMNSQRRQQHVNMCIDQEDSTRQEEIEHQQQIKVARVAVLNCPMCGKKFKVQSSRQSHLKKCALSHKMTVEQVKNLVKQQEEEYQSKLNIGILPDDFIPVKFKPPLGKHPSTSRLKSQFDEDTQLALALSTSLAEDQEKEGLVFNGLLGNTNFDKQAVQYSKGPGKSKKAKSTETASLLVSLSREEAMKRISDRVTRYTFPPNHGDSAPTTPPFKTTNKYESKSTFPAAPSSVKSCMQAQPDWWSRTSQPTSFEDPIVLGMSSETSRDVSYYVKELMPPVSMNSVAAGSKVKRVSCIPGRRRSGEVKQHHGTVGPGQIDQQLDVFRSREMEQYTGIVSGDRVNAGLPATISPLERFVSQATASSPLSQTVDVLTRLAMESDQDKGVSICSQIPSFQPDVTDDSDSGEYTVEPSGFCKETPRKVRSDSNNIQTSHLDLVNCPSFSDLVIMADKGAVVYAHKVFLHAGCPELLNMSIKKDGRDEVDLTAFSKESILCFLKYVYTGQIANYGSCLADVKQLAERFSVAALKAATSFSNLERRTVEDVQLTGGSTSDEGDDRNERNTFDDDDWLDVFQTQRDNKRLKSGETSTVNGGGDAQSGGDSDMDVDDKEGEKRNDRGSFDDNKLHNIFQTQKDNLELIDSGDHESRSSEEMEQCEEVTEKVNEEISNIKLFNVANERGYIASVERASLESDTNLTPMEIHDVEEVIHTVSKQFSGTECNNSKSSTDLYDGIDTDVFVNEEEKNTILHRILADAENKESKAAVVEIADEDASDKKVCLDNIFAHEKCKIEVSSLEFSGAESEGKKMQELALAPDEIQQSTVKREIQEDTITNEIQKDTVTNERQKDTVTNEKQKDTVTNERQKDAITSEAQQNIVKREISLESNGISCLETSTTNHISLELSGISCLTNSSTSQISLELSEMSCLQNLSTNDISLESSRISLLQNVTINEMHLKSSAANISENTSPSCVNLSIDAARSPSCVNLSTDEARNLSLKNNATTAGGSKNRKKKKTKVSVKEFKNIMHKALSGISETCQPLADLTDEDIHKIGIKIEQGLQAVSDPNDSVYIPSVLEDTGESTNEVIITHADIKTTRKKNRRQGKSQAKAQMVSSLLEHSQTVGNSSLVTQGLCAGSTHINHDKLALQADSKQSFVQHGKKAAQISRVTNVSSAQAKPQTMNKDPSVSTPTSHIEISSAVQTQASQATTFKSSPLKECSGKLYVAKLSQECLQLQIKPCSTQSLNNSSGASETVQLVSKKGLTPRILSEGLPARAPSNPNKTLDNASIHVHDDILRNSHSDDLSINNSSFIPKLISPSAQSTNSGYVSGEELFTDSEEDTELSKTQVTYKSPSDPSWILSTQQISSSPAKEDTVDLSIMQEVKLVRRNIFLQELAPNASVMKTLHSAEMPPSDSRSGGDGETTSTQRLTSPSSVEITAKGTKLQNSKDLFIFKQPGRSLASSTKCLSDNLNSTSVDNTQVNILIDLSLHLLHQPNLTVSVEPDPTASTKSNPTFCVENSSTGLVVSDQALSAPPLSTISSLQTNKDSRIFAKKRIELAAGPGANTSLTPEMYAGHSKTTTLVKRSQSSDTAHSRKATDSQIRAVSCITSKASGEDSTKPCPVKHITSDNSFHSPTKSSTSYCQLRKSTQELERLKSKGVTQSSLIKGLQTVTANTNKSPPSKHGNSILNMDKRASFSNTSSSTSRSSKNTESFNRTSPLNTERSVLASPACGQTQSSTDSAKSSGYTDCKSNSASLRTREDTVTCRTLVSRILPEINNDASTSQSERTPASEQSVVSMEDVDDDYSNIPASITLELGSHEMSKFSANEAFSEGKKMMAISSGRSVNLTSKFKELHQVKASLTRESDSSDLDSPLPLRKRLGLINPFQSVDVKQRGEMKKAASVTFPDPECSLRTEKMTGQNEVHSTSVNNQDKQHDDLWCIHEARNENRQFEFSEKTDNAKTPKQQTVRRQKNVKKAGKIPSPFTPMAPYDDMATPDLKKAVSKIGVRPLGKKRMREFLKRVYHETHQYETDSDYDGTPVKHKRSSSQPVQLSPKAMLSHLPIKAAAGSYTRTKIQPANKANSNKVNQTEKKDKHLAGVKSNSTRLPQKSRSQPQTQETLDMRTLGNEYLSSDDCVVALEGADMEQDEVCGSQDSSFSSDGPDLPEESILQGWPEDDVAPSNQVQSNQQTVTERLVQFIKSNPDIYESILMYEPLELDIVKKRIADSGIKVSMSHLMDFLDDRYITFTMKNMSTRNNCRQRRAQKSGKSPSKRKALSQH